MAYYFAVKKQHFLKKYLPFPHLHKPEKILKKTTGRLILI
jgi:hypothetical protein